MKKYLTLKLLVIIGMATFFQVTPQLMAQDDEFGISNTENSESQKKNESEILNDLFARMCRDDEKLGQPTLKKTNIKGKEKLVPIYYNPAAKKAEENPDPFRPIIRKEIAAPPTPVVKVSPTKPKTAPTAPAQPKIDPIQIKVKGIVGNEGNRLAIVDVQKGESDLTLNKDQIVDGKFKVVDILSDRVVVYSNKEQRRYTFKIHSDNEK